VRARQDRVFEGWGRLLRRLRGVRVNTACCFFVSVVHGAVDFTSADVNTSQNGATAFALRTGSASTGHHRLHLRLLRNNARQKENVAHDAKEQSTEGAKVQNSGTAANQACA